ncbi:MAG TPA: UvrB/UvrC motif-containing protein [Gemmataceae bacterium]|nr:UvrB/UvrC motif-containing protein [Gemmataceae bacterium]
MKCQFCSKPATMHLMHTVQKKTREMHLCDACAREMNLLPESPQELNVPAVLQLVMSHSQAPARSSPGDAVCPECGTPYAHFKAQGRLGCPHDYEVFRSMLEPLVERVQNNAVRHVGKVPRRHRRRLRRSRQVELEARLVTAIRSERYEEAAHLRDAIRALGADDES